MARLEPDELERHARDGFVVPRWRLPAAAALRIRTATTGRSGRSPPAPPGCTLHEHLHEERSALTLNRRLAGGAFAEGDALDRRLRPGARAMRRAGELRAPAAVAGEGARLSGRSDFTAGHGG
jgi:hypothetical protein